MRRTVPSGVALGRVFGVPVFVSWTTLLLITFIAVTYTGPRDTSGQPTRSYGVAVAFAVLLLFSVFLHELGHCVVSQGVGVPVRSITLYMLGGVTMTDAEARDPARSYLITIAGPLVSLTLGAAGVLALHALPGDGVAHQLALDLTVANLVLGAFNLLPGLPLDGGQLLRAAVWKLTGSRSTATRAAGWTGRGIAVAVVLLGLAMVRVGGSAAYPSMLWSTLVAVFVWVGATQAMRAAQVFERLPRLNAASMARRVVSVPADLPLAEALRRLAEERAGGIVVVDRQGRPDAVVVEQAVSATPEHRRPWVSVGAVSRSVSDGLTMPADLAGGDIVTAIQRHPATEYVVVDRRGGVVGVLTTADVAGVLGPATAR